MVMERYPHTATISYYGAGTTNSIGIYTPGTLVTIGIVCNIQPNSTKYIIGESGNMIGYSYNIFFPIFGENLEVNRTYSYPVYYRPAAGGDISYSASAEEVKNIPDDAKLTFFDKEHIILDLFPYQKHLEVKV